VRLDTRLEAKEPDHNPAEPYSMDKMFEAALYILKGMPTVLDRSNLWGATAPQDGWGRPSTLETHVKKDMIDVEQWGENLLYTLSQAMETGMANIMQRMQSQSNRYQSAIPAIVPTVPVLSALPGMRPNAYLSPIPQSRPHPRPGEIGSRCFMCHNPSHFLGDCKTVD
jgi:hypothetical protein